MAVKDIIHFIDKREGLQTFLSISLYFFIFFLIIGLGIYFEGSDERNDRNCEQMQSRCFGL